MTLNHYLNNSIVFNWFFAVLTAIRIASCHWNIWQISSGKNEPEYLKNRESVAQLFENKHFVSMCDSFLPIELKTVAQYAHCVFVTKMLTLKHWVHSYLRTWFCWRIWESSRGTVAAASILHSCLIGPGWACSWTSNCIVLSRSVESFHKIKSRHPRSNSNPIAKVQIGRFLEWIARADSCL